MKNKKGISLIVLVITILVMIILAGVVIVSLQDNNPIGKAKEAVAATDIAAYKDELNLNILNKLTENDQLKKEDVNETEWDKIKEYIPSMKQEHKGKFKIEKGELVEIGGSNPGGSDNAGFDEAKGVNTPVIKTGMIPIKYDESKGKWVICSKDDPKWYDYKNKKWANVMLSDGKYKESLKNYTTDDKTIVEEQDLGSMFVWIPRYAYSINKYKTEVDGEGTTQKIHDITFLKGTSDGKFRKTYDAKAWDGKKGTATPKIVHPAFTFDGKEINGFWAAKFEASNSGEKVKILPNKSTWQVVSLENCFLNCLKMNEENNIYGISKNINSHLIKNIEWGAIAYLTTSEYGFTPIRNDVAGSSGGNVLKQSTTGNVTGIYDMNGGSQEYVAAYIKGKNAELYQNAQNLFSDDELNPNYIKYFDEYDNYFIDKPTMHGDACYEIFKGDNRAVYNKDAIYNYNDNKNLFLVRGDIFADSFSGIFSLCTFNGEGIYNTTFRPTLIEIK